MPRPSENPQESQAFCTYIRFRRLIDLITGSLQTGYGATEVGWSLLRLAGGLSIGPRTLKMCLL